VSRDRPVALAALTSDGIVLSVPVKLRNFVTKLRAEVQCEAIAHGQWRTAGTLPTLAVIRRVFGETLELDGRLEAALEITGERKFSFRPSAGPRGPRPPGAFYASPYTRVFHRESCEWTGELGVSMLMFATTEDASRAGCRPCKRCV
jgi:hypothetical protein